MCSSSILRRCYEYNQHVLRLLHTRGKVIGAVRPPLRPRTIHLTTLCPNPIPHHSPGHLCPAVLLGLSSEANTRTSSPATFACALADSWAATAAASNISLPLAQKVENLKAPNTASTIKKLVPKKSKLGMFSASPFSSSSRDVKVSTTAAASTKGDFSDVV